jgi:hypothetical protein
MIFISEIVSQKIIGWDGSTPRRRREGGHTEVEKEVAKKETPKDIGSLDLWGGRGNDDRSRPHGSD